MKQIRVVDYIADFLYTNLGVKHVFLVTGGGSMFLNDGIAKHEYLEGIFNHHEQACAMGAVAYSKYKNSYAVAMTTSGCGATNAITGLLDAWQDNTPVFFISGQAKKKETVYNSPLSLRQLGVQEANIVAIVQSITKYSVMINEPKDVAYHLEKAAYLAMIGRPGPIWLDIPQDVQSATINVEDMKHFDSSKIKKEYKEKVTDDELKNIITLIKNSKRPVIIAGNGIRLGNAIAEFKTFIRHFEIPVTVSYLGIDLLSSVDPLYIGRLGIKGDRAGNFAVQNADLVIALGTRLSVALTGFEYSMFAREATTIVIDIDSEEHQKNTVKIDHFININVKDFFTLLNKQSIEFESRKNWIKKCQHWRAKWPVALSEYEKDNQKINKYTFVEHLNKHLNDNTAIVADAGSAFYVVAQALKIRANQRFITSGAQADMGFSLPAAIGTAFAKEGGVIAITGDGSFQMNIQELQTIAHNKLSIKIFVWNNNGYLSIRTTQNKFFEGRVMGTHKKTGISFPDLEKIAYAYGIQYYKASYFLELDSVIKQSMNMEGPVICEIMCPENQEIVPTVASMKREDGIMVSKPSEDMYPFLDRDEFYAEMIIKPLDE